MEERFCEEEIKELEIRRLCEGENKKFSCKVEVRTLIEFSCIEESRCAKLSRKATHSPKKVKDFRKAKSMIYDG